MQNISKSHPSGQMQLWAQHSAECSGTVLTTPALQDGSVHHPGPLSPSLLWSPLSSLALSHPAHSPHSGQMDLFKMQIRTCHSSVENPLMESLMTPHCHFRPPGDLQVWSLLALAASSPPMPHLLLSLLITLLSSCYSLTVLRPLLPQGLCTCWCLHLAPSSPLVDAYSFFQSQFNSLLLRSLS